MAVTEVRDAPARNVKFWSEMRFGVYVDTLADELTVEKTFPPVLVLDPGGAGRDVLLPAEADSEGLMFMIKNTADAAEDLTVKEDSDTTTIGTVSQNEMAIFVCDGTTWYSLVGGIT